MQSPPQTFSFAFARVLRPSVHFWINNLWCVTTCDVEWIHRHIATIAIFASFQSAHSFSIQRINFSSILLPFSFSRSRKKPVRASNSVISPFFLGFECLGFCYVYGDGQVAGGRYFGWLVGRDWPQAARDTDFTGIVCLQSVVGFWQMFYQE